MEIKAAGSKIIQMAEKYRYAILILLVGLIFMLLPTGNAEPPEVQNEGESVSSLTAEEQLSQILSSVKGAGRVEVLLSRSTGEHTIYQTNEDIREESRKTDTVTVTDGDRNETGLVIRTDPPVYLGAVIVCQGAGDPTVRLAIVEAVSKYTGLGAHAISVLEMK